MRDVLSSREKKQFFLCFVKITERALGKNFIHTLFASWKIC